MSGSGAESERREQAILAAVVSIPEGLVSTYGAVAALAGFPGRARLVGTLLGRLPAGSEVPWHRVVNAQGEIARRASPGVSEPLQRQLLEAEGVVFGRRGRIDLHRFGWP